MAKNNQEVTPSSTSSSKPEVEINVVKVPETISVKKEDFDEMLDRLKRLESVASKAGLQRYDASQPRTTVKIVKLRMYNGKLVIGWGDMVTNIVEKQPNGHWLEDQKVELFYSDNTKEIVALDQFNRHFVYVTAEVLEESTKQDGSVFFELSLENTGEIYKISNKFVN